MFLEGNQITNLDSTIFNSLVNLEVLYISENPLHSFPSKLLENLVSLLYLSISSTNIEIIAENSFDNLKNLVQLELKNNKISSLPAGIFSLLENLGNEDYSWLDLGGNKIKKLDSNAFGKFKFLKNFFINDNRIEAIERNFFDNFPRLNNLNAFGNQCVNKSFSIREMEPVLEEFEKCFEKWDDIEYGTTEVTTVSTERTTGSTQVPPTTPSAVSRLSRSVILLSFGLTVKFLTPV